MHLLGWLLPLSVSVPLLQNRDFFLVGLPWLGQDTVCREMALALGTALGMAPQDLLLFSELGNGSLVRRVFRSYD